MAILQPQHVDRRVLLTQRRPVGVLRSALGLWRTRVGLLIVVILGATAILGPLVAPHGPADFVGLPNTGPTAAARFGTDHIGQDVWSRFLDGGIEILVLAMLATLLGLVLRSILGLLAAYSLGVASNLNAPDWGLMIQENQVALVVQPWGVVLPMAAVALLTIGTGLIGDDIARSAAGIDRSRRSD